jgi:spermidine synthase
MPPRTRRLVYLLFLLSGGTALVYQVTWVRDLSLIFGASFQATSIVLASFMAGLALGGFCLGRFAGRLRRPLAVYAGLELGVAVFALVLPTLLRVVDGLYVAAALEAGGVTPALNLLRTLLAFGALVVPTFFMGATLPVLTQLMVSSHDEMGDRVAWLYGLNTLGAVGGTLFSAFVSIPAIGVSRTQFLAVAVNVGIAVLAFAIDRGLPTRSDPETEEAAAPSPDSPGAMAPLARVWVWPTRLAFWGTAVSGMCALALEVLWTRGIASSVGSTIYGFAVMLAAFLIGIWLGSWLHAVFPLRRIPESVQLGVALVLVGLLSFGASHAIPALPELMVRLNLFLYDDLTRVRGGTTLLLSFVVMLIPTLFMGMAFPLASEARARLRVGFGRSVGDTLGLNTLGSITGSLAAGFTLIPLFGLQRSMALAAAVSLAYGAVVLGAAAAAWLPERRPWVAFATLVAVCSAFALPGAVRPWDLSLLGAFQSHNLRRYLGDADRVDVSRQLASSRLLYYREGRGSTVSVFEQRGNRALVVTGGAVATDTLSDMQHELLLGHLPVLLHPAPRSALVVGLGAGITLGAVATHEEIETLKLVEIEPAVVEAAALFSHANDNALEDPRLEIAIQDGRNFLKTSPDRFDVITADPIHPWTAGSAYLYTAEYFRIAGAQLRDGGVMCQWLPAYGLSHDDFRSVVASFADAFPHATLWQTSQDALLIGSHAPLKVDLALLTRRLAQPRVARQLSLIGLETPLAFLSEFALDPEAVRAYAAGAPINSDDNLYLEFSSPLHEGSEDLQTNIRSINRTRQTAEAMLTDWPLHFASREEMRAEFDRYRSAKSETLEAELASIAASPTAPASGSESTSERLRAVLNELPEYGPARALLSIRLTQRALMALRRDELRVGHTLAREAQSLAPNSAEANYALGVSLLRLARFAEAIPHFERAVDLRPNRWRSHSGLALARAEAGQFSEAIAALERALELNPDDIRMQKRMARLRSLRAQR